jgi:choline dehydrogenase
MTLGAKLTPGGVMLMPSLVQNKGTGSVTLASVDQNTKPLFNHNIFQNEKDYDVFIAGAKMAAKLLRFQPSMNYVKKSIWLAPPLKPTKKSKLI